MKKLTIFTFIFLIFTPILASAQAGKLSDSDLDSLLHFYMQKFELPALGAAIITDDKLTDIDVIGVRKYGDTTRATIHDLWHIGSDTKSMTATMIGKLVELGNLKWDTKIIDVFPELKHKIDTAFERVTMEMLLCHRSGIKADSWPNGWSFDSVMHLPGSPREQRVQYTKLMLAETPQASPGTEYIYANAGFIIAGAMAERVMNQSYEELMKKYVFGPLGMKSVGYGSMNTPDKVDQPWQHIRDGKNHISINGGPESDNPVVLTPAGRVHLTLQDWSKYAIAHLMGESIGGILKPETFKKLHSLPFGEPYGFGWLIVQRDWAKGTALSHDGSNGQNYASMWVIPNLKFALLLVTNDGSDQAGQAIQNLANDIVTKMWVPPAPIH